MDMKKRIIRVFPTKTNATPTDELVRIRETPSFFDEADEVHVSVTFTWDIPIAEWLAKQWEPVATVKIGGPAYNEPGGDFIPGMYMRHGYVSLFFAYDTPNDLDPLVEAGKMLIEAGFTKSSNSMRCYVLCGYKGDTFEKAQTRMGEAWRAGFMPMAMLFRDLEGKYSTDWRRFQRQWANPTITICNCIKHFGR